jgi:aspartyl-tRNA(Asn)/glutamyl-tRNA(Gln) amidotransferase subunit A
VAGLKPSFGRVPYVPAGADRLAHLGPLARSVADVATAFAVMAGPHPADPDSQDAAPAAPLPARPLRIGWIEFPGTDPAIRAATEPAIEALTGRGHEVYRIDVPFADPYAALVDLVAAAEAAGTGPDDHERADPGRLAVARYGQGLSAADLVRAEEVRLALRRRTAEVMAEFDLLAMATVPIEPFALDLIAPPGPTAPVGPADLRWLAWAPAAYPFNLTGQPALSLPVGLTPARLPAAVQLVGRRGADELVLATGHALETDLRFTDRPPGPANPPRSAEHV